uniref:TLC domain-containing protein n=1 Tax=Plectus sambesii TaxID=2011161 RepID=A0A914UQH4_9BILA
MMFIDWEQDQWERVGIAVVQVIISFCFFRLLQYAVRWYLFGKWSFPWFAYFSDAARNEDAESMQEVSALATPPRTPHKKWRISNEAVSLLHSAISGIWALSACVLYPQMFSNMHTWYNSSTSYLILMSTGYLLHDLLDLLINEGSLRILELLFHHVVVLTAFYTTLSSEKFLGVVVCGLLMEVNSIFLHSRSLLNLYGWSKASSTYRFISLMNMLTLFIFRMAVSVYLLVWQIMTCWDLVWYYVLVTFVVILSLGITNTVLAYRVLAADGYLGESRARLPPPPPVIDSKDGGNLVLVTVDTEE